MKKLTNITLQLYLTEATTFKQMNKKLSDENKFQRFSLKYDNFF